jgi:hypothetical protein
MSSDDLERAIFRILKNSSRPLTTHEILDQLRGDDAFHEVTTRDVNSVLFKREHVQTVKTNDTLPRWTVIGSKSTDHLPVSGGSDMVSGPCFPNRLTKDHEFGVAMTLAAVCHYIHPEVAAFMRQANSEHSHRFKELFPIDVEMSAYLYPDSACVFPGVRRSVGAEDPRSRKYVPSAMAILDTNEVPRHLWAFLAGGVPYTGTSWKSTRLNEFELSHVFSHKANERREEERVFAHFDPAVKPYGLFTCATNTVLIPKGLAKPTDALPSVRLAFFQRHIDLYGEVGLPGIKGLNETHVPEWYRKLKWADPIVPPNWERKVKELLEHRFQRLKAAL